MDGGCGRSAARPSGRMPSALPERAAGSDARRPPAAIRAPNRTRRCAAASPCAHHRPGPTGAERQRPQPRADRRPKPPCLQSQRRTPVPEGPEAPGCRGAPPRRALDSEADGRLSHRSVPAPGARQFEARGRPVKVRAATRRLDLRSANCSGSLLGLRQPRAGSARPAGRHSRCRLAATQPGAGHPRPGQHRSRPTRPTPVGLEGQRQHPPVPVGRSPSGARPEPPVPHSPRTQRSRRRCGRRGTTPARRYARRPTPLGHRE